METERKRNRTRPGLTFKKESEDHVVSWQVKRIKQKKEQQKKKMKWTYVISVLTLKKYENMTYLNN